MSEIPTTARALLDRLQRYYVKANSIGAGGMFAAEVGENGTFGQSQRCDAVYVGFTSASGRQFVGHEVKVSRSDWQHELDQIEKADRWADACHEWWVVAPSTKIVPPETVPAGWGLMIPNARGSVRFDKVVPAARRDFDPPWWAVRSFMARFDTLNVQALDRLADERGREISASLVRHAQAETERARRENGGSAALTWEQQRSLTVVQKLSELGVDLADFQAPLTELAAVWPGLRAGRSAERALNQLRDRWSGVAHLAETAQELVAAVDAMKITAAVSS